MATEENRAPSLPDATGPWGSVWPPAEGRTILTEIETTQFFVRQLRNGDWRASGDGNRCRWELRSRKADLHRTLQDGRNALLELARAHEHFKTCLSARCLALAEESDGTWRLWQVLQLERSLRDALVESLIGQPAERSAGQLRDYADQFVKAVSAFEGSRGRLPATLDSVGEPGTEGPLFVDFFPPDLEASSAEDPLTLLEQRFEPQIAETKASVRFGAKEIEQRLKAIASSEPKAAPIIAVLVRILASDG